MSIYLGWMYVLSLAVGYALAFSRATLSLGRSLSETDSQTGVQDAITPPGVATVTLWIYAISLGSLVYGAWRFGFLRSIGVVVAFYFAVAINKVFLLPKPESEHFRNVILRSMIGRHADYVKSGDALRASAMGNLLTKMGMPVDEFVDRLKETEDA